MNRLYFGDNLAWLRDKREFPDASAATTLLDLTGAVGFPG